MSSYGCTAAGSSGFDLPIWQWISLLAALVLCLACCLGVVVSKTKRPARTPVTPRAKKVVSAEEAEELDALDEHTGDKADSRKARGQSKGNKLVAKKDAKFARDGLPDAALRLDLPEAVAEDGMDPLLPTVKPDNSMQQASAYATSYRGPTQANPNPMLPALASFTPAATTATKAFSAPLSRTYTHYAAAPTSCPATYEFVEYPPTTYAASPPTTTTTTYEYQPSTFEYTPQPTTSTYIPPATTSTYAVLR